MYCGGSSGYTKDWTVTFEKAPSPSAQRGTAVTIGGGGGLVHKSLSTTGPKITHRVLKVKRLHQRLDCNFRKQTPPISSKGHCCNQKGGEGACVRF